MLEEKEPKDVWLLSSWVASMSMSFTFDSASTALFCLSLLFSSLYVCVSFKLSSYKVVMVVAFSLLFFCLQVAADQFCFMLPLPSPFSLSLMFCSSSLVMRKRKSTSRRRDRGWLYVFAPSLSSLSFPSIPARRAFMYVRTNKNE
jgi:hypothetical protein